MLSIVAMTARGRKGIGTALLQRPTNCGQRDVEERFGEVGGGEGMSNINGGLREGEETVEKPLCASYDLSLSFSSLLSYSLSPPSFFSLVTRFGISNRT